MRPAASVGIMTGAGVGETAWDVGGNAEGMPELKFWQPLKNMTGRIKLIKERRMDVVEKIIFRVVPENVPENGLYYNSGMIEMTIPGRGLIRLENLVCDVNGTLAEDGKLIPGVAKKFEQLSDRLKIHLITADTLGKQAKIDDQLNLKAIRVTPGDEARQKLDFIKKLGSETCASIGQGANDALMLKEAAIGICVLSAEGTSAAAMASCDIVTRDIISALDLLEKTQRIQATLRQ